jgi:8-oxo-dGTP pyrophosphatase MutT (NUDIX family)
MLNVQARSYAMAGLNNFLGFLLKAVQPLHRMTRGLTLGVRIAAFDDAGQVLLVRHTYTPGWSFPGGGVDTKETLRQAAVRELREEAGLIAEETPRLHGMFSNEQAFPGDHVACFIVRRFRRIDWSPNLEIMEIGFYPPNNLPEDTTGGTRRRIEEILTGSQPAEQW